MGSSFLAATFPFSSPEEYSYMEFSGRAFRKCSRILRYLVRQWILVAPVYGLCLATETGTHSANCARTSHRCSSWTSLTCPLCSETGTFSAVCVQTVEIPQVPFLVELLTCPLLCMSRSSTSPSWRRGRFPWSSDQIMRFPCCSPSIRWSISWLYRLGCRP